MAKTHVNITVDYEYWLKAKELNINLSRSFNDFLGTLIAQTGRDINKINILMVQKELAKLKTQMASIASEITQKESLVVQYQAIQDKKQKELLEKEKDRIMKSKTCLKCQRELTKEEKQVSFPKGIVCQGCFMTASKDDVNDWNRVE